MKKINVLFSAVLFLVISISLAGLSVKAFNLRTTSTDECGTLKLTFIRNQVSDKDVAFHIWNTGSNAPDTIVSRDGIFVTAEIFIMEDAQDEIGVIPTLDDGNGGNDWDNKLSYGGADILIDVTDIKGGGVKHAFIYENAKAGEIIYSTTNEENYLMFVTYYSASYEENLGFHSWGFISEHTATSWGTPLTLFKTIGRAPDGTEIKGAVLESSSKDGAGALIYAGSDDSKKHSDYGDLTFFDDTEASTPQFMGVANSTVYTKEEAVAFTEEAFSLRFMDFSVSSNGSYEGTYAVNSTSILVSLSTTILVPKVKVEADEDNNIEEVLYTEEERINLVKEMFNIYLTNDVESKIEIESIDFDKNSDTIKDFVFTLKDELLFENEYSISYENADKYCDIEINMDKEVPVITLLRGNDIIEIPWGEAFDMKYFPQYEATDDRDGDITSKVYVPSGKGFLDTSEVGDYEITLRVIDSWGNSVDKVITFRVVK